MAYKVKNIVNKDSLNLQKEIKSWIEGMSSINIQSISIWHDHMRNVHLATIVYESFIHQ